MYWLETDLNYDTLKVISSTLVQTMETCGVTGSGKEYCVLLSYQRVLRHTKEHKHFWIQVAYLLLLQSCW